MTHFFQVLTSVSLFTAFVIAVCRYVNVRYPLMLLPNFIVYSTVIVLPGARVLLIVIIMMFMSPTLCWDRKTFHVMRVIQTTQDTILFEVMIYIKAALSTLVCSIGLFVSMATVMTLKSSNSNMGEISSRNSRKSSLAILLLNIGPAILLGIYISYMMDPDAPIIKFLAVPGFTIILSAANPLIRVILSTDIKENIKQMVISGRAILHQSINSLIIASSFKRSDVSVV